MATIIHKAENVDHSPESPDEKKVAEYVFSNFSPLIGHAVRKLKAKGHLPTSAQEEDHHEPGVNGLMHAVNSYNSEAGDFKPYALKTIMGYILQANKPKGISQHDIRRIRGFKQEGGQEAGQQVTPVKDSSRRVTEDLGQSFEGGEGSSQTGGVSVEKDPSMATANIVQNVPQAKEWVQSKVQQAAKRLNPDLLPDDVRKRLEAIKQAKSVTPPSSAPAQAEQPASAVPSVHGEVKSVTDPAELARIQAEYEKKYKK